MISDCLSVSDQFFSPSFNSTCTRNKNVRRSSAMVRASKQPFLSIFTSAEKGEEIHTIREKQTANGKTSYTQNWFLLPPSFHLTRFLNPCVPENAIQSFGYGSEGGTLLATEAPSTILPPAQPPIISKPSPPLHGNAIKPMDSACMFSTCANLQVSSSSVIGGSTHRADLFTCRQSHF